MGKPGAHGSFLSTVVRGRSGGEPVTSPPVGCGSRPWWGLHSYCAARGAEPPLSFHCWFLLDCGAQVQFLLPRQLLVQHLWKTLV